MNKITLAAALSLLLAACSTPPRPETPKPECTLDSECPSGQLCGPAGKCTAECAADADCSAPETCQAGACVIPAGLCRANSECSANQVCGASDKCVEKCTAAASCKPTEACIAGGCLLLSTQMDQCNLNSDCTGSQSCVNGRCATACASTRDCPVGSECESGSCVLPIVECFASSDCAAGEACSPGGRCVTSCTTATGCAATEACSNGACVATGTSVAAISGTVAITGVTAASGVTVKLEGNNHANAITGNDGTYKFDGLTTSVYRLTYSASSTVEGTLIRETFARIGQTTTVATVTFTPAGSITGNATLQNKTNHLGINVLVSGTNKSALTDAAGNFRIDGVPAGTYSLVFTAAGYLAQTRPNIAVTYAGTASVTGVTLNEPPTATGQTFAFLSTPPMTTRVDRTFNYTAQAGGAGVTNVTYGLTTAPVGMTIDPSSGAVSWDPDSVGGELIAISASGGGVTIYQVWTLDVTAAMQHVSLSGADDLLPADGGTWINTYGGAAYLDYADGGVGPGFNGYPPNITGTSPTLQLLNGGKVTNVKWTGGKLTSAQGAFGTLASTFEGGKVSTITAQQVYNVASKSLKSFPLTGYTVDHENTITQVSYPTGPVATITDTRKGFSLAVPTGVVSSVAANVLTDSAATWTANQFVGSCLIDTTRNVNAAITANDATTFTVAATTDLSLYFPVGGRYLVANCSSANITVTLTDPTAVFTGTPVGRALDVYTNNSYVGGWNTTAITATTLTFTPYFTEYQELVTAASNGTYALRNSANSHDATLTDPTANFPASMSTTYRVAFDDFNSTYQIISNTTTSITYRVGAGAVLLSNAARVGRNWVLTDTSWYVAVTATVQNPLSSPPTGQLLIDRTGITWDITSTTANAYVTRVYISSMPVNNWVGSLVAPTANTGSYYFPAATATTSAALAPGSMIDRALMLVDAAGPAYTWIGDIASNSASSLRLNEWYCGSVGCAGRLSLVKTYVGATAAPGRDPGAELVDFQLTLSGTPNFSPDSLIGRLVTVEGSRSATGVVVGNGTNTLDIEVDEADYALWQTLPANAAIWLSEPRVGSTTPTRVRLTDATGGWTNDQWAGYVVVTTNGVILGNVTANTANTLDVTATDLNALNIFGVGSVFGLAKQHSGGNNCNPGYWVKSQVTMTGGTLQASTYDGLVAQNAPSVIYQVTSNTTSTAQLLVCSDLFDNFVTTPGRYGLFSRAGVATLTLTDSTANWPTNAYVGRSLYLNGPGFAASYPTAIGSNTQTQAVANNLSATSVITFVDDLVPGLPFFFPDASGYMDVTLETDLTLTPNAFAGRIVELHSGFNTPDDFFVSSNDGSRLIGGLRLAGNMGSLVEGLGYPKFVTLSAGVRLQLTDATKSWPVNSLVGRHINFGSKNYEIMSNTATTVIATSPDESSLASALVATSYSVSTYSTNEAMAALSSGEALLGSSLSWSSPAANRNSGLYRVAKNGTLAGVITPTGTARSFTVTPKALTQTGVLSFNPIQSPNGVHCTYSDPSWSFTADALLGSYLQVYNSSAGSYSVLPIASNTQTSITTLGCPNSINLAAGRPYSIHPARYTVTGATLTADELKGKLIRINGVDVRVRSNTPSELHIVFAATAFFNDALLDPAELGGSTAYVYDRMPREVIQHLISDGAAGFYVAAGNQIVHFNGTTWSRVTEVDGATIAATGTVSSYSGLFGIQDDAANYANNDLVGMKLVLPTGVFNITGNSSNTISVNATGGGVFTNGVVAPGTPYTVYRSDGVTSHLVQTMALAGGTLWVGTSGGLFKRVGTTWTRYTQANTESATGLRDGLYSDDVEHLAMLSATDVAVSAGFGAISRLNGTTWTQYTRANTESALDLGDGLYNDGHSLLARGPSGSLIVGHFGAMSILSGTTWTQLGANAGGVGSIYGYASTPQGHLWAGNRGVFRLLP